MMLDITVLTPKISVGGGIFNKTNAQHLNQMGITHVLNMKGEFDEGPLFEGTPVKSLWMPFYDVMASPTTEVMDACSRFIQKAFRNQESRIHCVCAAGCHRGPMAALLALCMDGMEIENAEDLVLSKRLIASYPKVYYDAVKNQIKRIDESRKVK